MKQKLIKNKRPKSRQIRYAQSNDKESLWGEVKELHRKIDTMFENFYNTDPLFRDTLLTNESGEKIAKYKHPAADVYETENNVVVEVEMPGIDRDDIEINVTENYIEIKAEMNTEIKQGDKKKNQYRVERNYMGFYRRFPLPALVDESRAVAEYRNGILKVTVPELNRENKKKRFVDVK